MASNKKLLALPGDGIGPEVMRQVYRIVEWFDRHRIVSFDVSEDLCGGAAYDAHGTPLAESTLQAAMSADAVLFGAVGGPPAINIRLKVCRKAWRCRTWLGRHWGPHPCGISSSAVDAHQACGTICRRGVATRLRRPLAGERLICRCI